MQEGKGKETKVKREVVLFHRKRAFFSLKERGREKKKKGEAGRVEKKKKRRVAGRSFLP